MPDQFLPSTGVISDSSSTQKAKNVLFITGESAPFYYALEKFDNNVYVALLYLFEGIQNGLEQAQVTDSSSSSHRPLVSATNTTFYYFAKFPQEVQNMIWEYACHHPHTHFHDTLPTSDHITDGRMIIQDATKVPSLPSMLYTTRRSRYIGLRNYTKVPRVLFNANLSGGLLERCVYVNFSCDIIRFPAYAIQNAVNGRPRNSLTWGFRALDLGKFRHVEVEALCVDMFYKPPGHPQQLQLQGPGYNLNHWVNKLHLLHKRSRRFPFIPVRSPFKDIEFFCEDMGKMGAMDKPEILKFVALGGVLDVNGGFAQKYTVENISSPFGRFKKWRRTPKELLCEPVFPKTSFMLEIAPVIGRMAYLGRFHEKLLKEDEQVDHQKEKMALGPLIKVFNISKSANFKAILRGILEGILETGMAEDDCEREADSWRCYQDTEE